MMNLAPSLFGRLSKVTRVLILISLAVFVLEFFIRGYIIYFLGLVPVKVLGSGWLWQIFTYLFVHGGFWHFFFNMLMLWIFGGIMERTMGGAEFLRYFLVTGVGAGIVTLLFSPNSSVPVVGASGAIYGLMIAFAIFYPDAKVYLYFLFPVTSRQMVIFLVILELAMSFSGTNPHVANVAHLGGMLVGYLYLRRSRMSGAVGRMKNLFARQKNPEDEINRILSKISRKGINSLSRSEKEFLDKFSGRS